MKTWRHSVEFLRLAESSLSICLILAAVLGLPAARAHAQADDAGQILKAMSDYVASQKTISATFNSDIEVLTSDLQKDSVQFFGSISAKSS